MAKIPTIVDNRICYEDHEVVCDPKVATPEYMQDMCALLSPDGSAADHWDELDACNNNGSWILAKNGWPHRLFLKDNHNANHIKHSRQPSPHLGECTRRMDCNQQKPQG